MVTAWLTPRGVVFIYLFTHESNLVPELYLVAFLVQMHISDIHHCLLVVVAGMQLEKGLLSSLFVSEDMAEYE